MHFTKASTKDFVAKRKIYQQCLEKKDVGDGMPYLEILREVVSYNNSYLDEKHHLSEDAIKKRGKRLGLVGRMDDFFTMQMARSKCL